MLKVSPVRKDILSQFYNIKCFSNFPYLYVFKHVLMDIYIHSFYYEFKHYMLHFVKSEGVQSDFTKVYGFDKDQECCAVGFGLGLDTHVRDRERIN